MSKQTGAPDVSVVIPTKNGRSTLGPCLEAILGQRLCGRVEIIVIDSGSTDGTLDLLARYPVKQHRISPEDFNHGETRNLGVRLAQGEFVAMTVQDARPADDRWLERMLKHFDDPQVAGVCGQQVVPHEPDKNPLQWFRPYSAPLLKRIRFENRQEFEDLSPAEKVAQCGWDNVTAMYRRSALVEIPFRMVSFAEDLIWAREALACGRLLVYDYASRVYHYHRENFGFRFRRHYTIQYHIHRYFGHVSAPTGLVISLARSAYYISRRKYCPQRRASWLAYNARLIIEEWLSGWCFWFCAKMGGMRVVEKTHKRLCTTPPQPQRV